MKCKFSPLMRNQTVALIMCVQSKFLEGSLKALILPTLTKTSHYHSLTVGYPKLRVNDYISQISLERKGLTHGWEDSYEQP